MLNILISPSVNLAQIKNGSLLKLNGVFSSQRAGTLPYMVSFKGQGMVQGNWEEP